MNSPLLLPLLMLPPVGAQLNLLQEVDLQQQLHCLAGGRLLHSTLRRVRPSIISGRSAQPIDNSNFSSSSEGSASQRTWISAVISVAGRPVPEIRQSPLADFTGKLLQPISSEYHVQGSCLRPATLALRSTDSSLCRLAPDPDTAGGGRGPDRRRGEVFSFGGT